jgi:hypothetical protein
MSAAGDAGTKYRGHKFLLTAIKMTRPTPMI